jgi:WD40 repeat protein
MLKPENLSLTFAYGHASNGNKRTNVCFYTSEEEPRMVYLIGRQVVVEKIQKDLLEILPSNSLSIPGRGLEFVQFNESINKSMLKHTNYRFQNFCYDKASKRGFINIKIMDENSKRFPKILIFDFKEQRNFKLEFFDSKTDFFVNAVFAPNCNGRYLVALTKNQPQHVFFYDLNAMRILGISPIPKEEKWEKVTTCPNDSFLILLTSKNQTKIRVLRINDNLPISEVNLKYCLREGVGALEWITNDVFVVADSSGFALSVISHEKKSKFEIIQRIEDLKVDGYTDDFFKNANINGIKKFSKGLIVFTSVNLFLVLIRKEEFIDYTGENEHGLMVFYSCFKFEAFENFMPCSVDFTTKEDQLLVSFEKQGLLSVPTEDLVIPHINNMQMKKLNGLKLIKVSEGVTIIREICSGIKDMICSEHASTIAVSRDDPFNIGIVTPGDKINNFDFVFKPKVESSKIITAEFHPSGQYIVCSFKDKIQGFNISFKKFFFSSENNLLKGSYLLRFSDGGGLLACCHLETKNNFYPISLMESFSLNILKSVNTHSHSSRISDLLFTSISTHLWSSSVDGCLFAWSLPSFHKKEVLIEKEMKFICMDIFLGVDLVTKALIDFVYILSEDAKGTQYIYSQQIENSDKCQRVPLPSIIDQGVPVRHTFLKTFNLQDKVRGVVLGNNLGYIIVYNGITNLAIPNAIINTPCSQDITRIAFSMANSSLTISSKEGVVAIYDMSTESTPKHEKSCLLNEEYLSMSGDRRTCIVVDYDLIRRYERRERECQQEIDDIRGRNDMRISEDKFDYEEKLQGLELRYKTVIEKKDEEIELLNKRNALLESQYSNLIKNIESDNMQAVDEIEKLYEAKINHQAEKLTFTEKNEKLEKLKYEKIITNLKEEKEHTVNDIENRFKAQLALQEQKLKSLNDQINSMLSKQEFDLATVQTEHDNIITQMKHQNLTKVKGLEEKFNSCRKDFQTVKNDRDCLKSEKEAIQKEIASKENIISQINSQTKHFEDQINNLVEEKETLKDVINEQDQKLNHFAKLVDDLEKTKNVLTFRTAEMRKGMEPKELQIDRLKGEVVRLEIELEHIIKKMADKETVVAKKFDEVKSAQTIIQKLNNEISDKDNWIKNMATIITNCVQQTDPKNWGVYMKKLYSIISESNSFGESKTKSLLFKKENLDQQHEVSGQIHCLQSKITQLNKNKQKAVTYHTKHLETKTEENATLLSELNILRINYKNLSSLKNSLAISNGQLVREVKMLQKEMKKMGTVMKSNVMSIETQPKEMKESTLKINNSFKIKSITKVKNEPQMTLVEEILNDRSRVNDILYRLNEEDKDDLIVNLVHIIN